MKKEMDLLTSLYKNASMGTSTIKTILPKIRHPQLCQELEAQLDNYQHSCRKFRSMLPPQKRKPDLRESMAEFYANASIQFSTLLDSSTSRIAELMIQGTNMGVIEIAKALNTDHDALPHLKQDASALLKKQQQYMDKLKYYL